MSDAVPGESACCRCRTLCSWGLLTRWGGARAALSQASSRVVEGDAESVFRPLAAESWASDSGGKRLGASAVGWRENASVETCQKGAAVSVSRQAKVEINVHSARERSVPRHATPITVTRVQRAGSNPRLRCARFPAFAAFLSTV
jgi:hypothetical protein